VFILPLTVEEYKNIKKLEITKKLDKAGRTWKPVTVLPYRNAELFCENCGKSVGVHDIICTDVRTLMYCSDCAQVFLRPVPYQLADGIDVVFDNGVTVGVEYTGGYYDLVRVNKICYYNKKGRFIKIKGKQYYLNDYNPYMP
jgi:hypothetical protein